MRAVVTLLIAAVLAAPAPARADDKRVVAERYFRTGDRLFSAGEFVAAARAFEDAYAILPLPAIAFSGAQAYRLAWVRKDPGHLRRAVELYRIYIEQVPKGERVVEASAALGELEAVLRAGTAGGVAPPAPRSTGVTITSSIAGVTVAVDGGEAGPLPIVRDLAPGQRIAAAGAAGYAAATVEFQVVDGVMVPVEIDLAALPARVAVRAEAGSDLAVDGRAAGTAPLAAPLELPAGRHFVSVSRRGRVAFGQEVEVGRGQEVAIVARQPLTGQRRAARWTLIGAGVLAVGAGPAATFAWIADGDAADLEARRASVGLSVAERDRYEALRGDRDDRRALAIGLGGAALAVGVTGALLYWFDRDVAERAPAIAPAVSAGGGGVTIGGRF